MKTQELYGHVNYSIKRGKKDIRVEECHGLHTFDDTEEEVVLEGVYIEVGGRFLDVTKFLPKEVIELIKKDLDA